MARRDAHEPLEAPRTRTSATYVAIGVAVLFLVLLIIFIAQNNKKVPIHFLGANGHVSEALALIASAVAGAILVLAVSSMRILQLRFVGRRHNRAVAKDRKQAKAQAKAAAAAPPAESAAAAPVGEPQAVQPQDQP
jgi:uncharacterized integral membrane protein